MNKHNPESVDLTGLNRPTVAQKISTLKKRFTRKPKHGRDNHGKFVTGHGGHHHHKKLDWHRSVVIVLAVSLAGGFLVFRTFATTKTISPKDSSAVVTCAYSAFLNRKPDPNGASHWQSKYTTSNFNSESLAANLLQSKEGQRVAYTTSFDSFIQRTYKSCMNRTATAKEVSAWSKQHLSGMSRQAIFNFIVQVGDRPFLAPETCKAYTKGGSVKPLCKTSTKGLATDVSTQQIKDTNIHVNQAWVKNIQELRAAASKAGFNLQGNQDPKVPYPAASYRSPAAQKWLSNNGYPAAKPGTSMHEWGLAIDLACNGVSLGKNANCLKWMKANANRYGVYNLPSEPWHWSSNGH